jgi:hypothetical protein
MAAEDSAGSFWLLSIAILMLAGFAAGTLLGRGDFHEPRVLHNAWFHLGVLAAAVGLLLGGAAYFRGRLLLRLQMALLLSLLVHAALLVYMHSQYLAILAQEEVARMQKLLEPPDELHTLPDYQFDDRGEVVVANRLERPAETELLDVADSATREVDPSAEPLFDAPLETDALEATVAPEPLELARDEFADEVPAPPPTEVSLPRSELAAPVATYEAIALPAPSSRETPPALFDPSITAGADPPELRSPAANALSDLVPATPIEPLGVTRERNLGELVPATLERRVLPADAAAEEDRSQVRTGDAELSRAARIPRSTLGATVPRATLQADVPQSPVPGLKQTADLDISTVAHDESRGNLPDVAEITTSAGKGVVESGRSRGVGENVQRVPQSGGRGTYAAQAPRERTSIRELLDLRRERIATNPRVPEVPAEVVEAPRRAPESKPAADMSTEPRLASRSLDTLGPALLENQRLERSAPPALAPLPMPNAAAGNLAQELASIERGRLNLEKSLSAPHVAERAEPAPAFRQRSAEQRERSAVAGGGTARSERAVELGLQFLARMQHADGRWSLHDFRPEQRHPDASMGTIQADTAATGLALLSYLGAGYTHRTGKYRETVRTGLNHLLTSQKANGDLFAGGSSYAWLYSHGIASIALCEAYGMTRDPLLREPAERALTFIVSAQHPTLGGWRYVPGRESDTSVSGWQMMALKSGELAGLNVPRDTYQRMSRWLDVAASRDPTGARYAYLPAAELPHQRDPSRAMTAEALLMRLYLGWRKDDPRLVLGVEYLEERLPRYGEAADRERDAYYWYYATQVLFQVGGPTWEAWNDTLRELLVASQVDDGPWIGSWHPTQPVPDRWGAQAGRLYVTAMHVLMLEVYYRHLPLYRSLVR